MEGKTRKEIGAWGEAQAALFLERHGYTVCRRNYRTRYGELDIIAWKDDPTFGRTLCFVEVKTRSYGVGSAERATGRQKRARMQKAARHYCSVFHIDIGTTPIQFEHISVYRGKEKSQIRHFVLPVPGSPY